MVPLGAALNVASFYSTSFGSVAHFLGLLAATLGRHADAIEWLKRAIERNEAMEMVRSGDAVLGGCVLRLETHLLTITPRAASEARVAARRAGRRGSSSGPECSRRLVSIWGGLSLGLSAGGMRRRGRAACPRTFPSICTAD